MTTNERFLKLATATPEQCAQVDAILDGSASRQNGPQLRLLSVTDAAKMMDISRMTVYRLKKAGRLASVELPGGTERITLASVLALIGKAG